MFISCVAAVKPFGPVHLKTSPSCTESTKEEFIQTTDSPKIVVFKAEPISTIVLVSTTQLP